ncbi:MAG: sensor histidine kinase [Cytophagaceae bacterium]|jgi:hypothetical protein|nr:sensor histidine kinase [Cytophagaceae bacterium]
MGRLCGLFLCWCLPIFIYANHTLILNNDIIHYELTNDYFTTFKDSSNQMHVSQVLKQPFQHSSSLYSLVNDSKSTFWSKIEFIDSSAQARDWFFVFYNYSIEQLDFYLLAHDSLLLHRHYSVNSTKLSDKELKHKNFSIDLEIPKNTKITILLKSRNSISSQYGYAIKEHKDYFSYSVTEYFYYGLFYGSLLLIIIYHISFLFSLKNIAYLFYVLYTLFQGIYMTFRDGMVVAYVFPEHPALVGPAYAVVYMCSSLFLMLYARFFLELNNNKFFDLIIKIYIPLRIAAWIIAPKHNNFHVLLDYIPVIVVFAFSLQATFQKIKTSYLLCAGFGALLISHTINALWQNNIIPCTTQIFYSMYYGILIESTLLAFANAYRLHTLRQEAIQKLKLENQVMKDELKINQQKNIIQEQKDQIENFLYRASHDIKGPLKSIDGLARLGLIDQQYGPEYFSRIQRMTIRLQKIVDNFLSLVKNNNSPITVEEVRLKEIVQQCLEDQFLEYPGRNEITIENLVDETVIVETEYFSLYSILQNILENAIKYRDPQKPNKYIRIQAKRYEFHLKLEVEDNGQGIHPSFKEKVFSMFYRANIENTEGVGMGLYIVKQSLERIQGKVRFESEEGKFTKFIIQLPLKI